MTTERGVRVETQFSILYPVACTIGCPEALENYTGGVFNDTTGYKSPDHDIEVGWVGRVCVISFATRERGVRERARARERGGRWCNRKVCAQQSNTVNVFSPLVPLSGGWVWHGRARD